jgi:primary-amine oxidase
VGFDPHEGVVLHQVTYDDQGRERTILHRASVSEMVVPYGDPGPLHGWKNAFDAGEWGLGRMTQSLTLGCDCLGEIRYFDATLASETGDPYTIENAICLHEEDYGILWKHVDLFSGTSEVRRSRRLVVNAVSTVGNYEYAFAWYLYLDGNIQLEVKLTGIVSPMAIEPGTTSEFANVIAPGIAAPHHQQHLFNVSWTSTSAGPTTRSTRSGRRRCRTGRQPVGQRAPAGRARLETETRRARKTNPATSRSWKIVNPHVTNGLGQRGLQSCPHDEHADAARAPDSSVGKRAGFAQRRTLGHAVLTDERRAGEHPNQHEGGDGLLKVARRTATSSTPTSWLWYTFGVTHFVRPGGLARHAGRYAGFLASHPNGFFDRQPRPRPPPHHQRPLPLTPARFWRRLGTT